MTDMYLELMTSLLEVARIKKDSKAEAEILDILNLRKKQESKASVK